MCFLCFVLYVCTVLSNECERVVFSYSHRPIYIGYLKQTCHWLYMYVSRAWHWSLVFPRLPLRICFPALAPGVTFSPAWHWLLVFPRLALLLCFPALDFSYFFPRACHYFCVFPRVPLVSCFPGLPLVTCFPALATGFMFSGLATGYLFSRACQWFYVFRAWHWLLVFPRLLRTRVVYPVKICNWIILRQSA